MDIRIQSVHFDATEKLQAFIEKKVGKIAKSCDQAAGAEVVLKVTKPETAMNKEVQVRINVPGGNLHAEKQATLLKRLLTCVSMLYSASQKNTRKNMWLNKKNMPKVLRV